MYNMYTMYYIYLHSTHWKYGYTHPYKDMEYEMFGNSQQYLRGVQNHITILYHCKVTRLELGAALCQLLKRN